MSTESTARTPLPYRFVRLWVSTIVVLVVSMPTTLGSAVPHVVTRKTDLWRHPWGRDLEGDDCPICRLSTGVDNRFSRQSSPAIVGEPLSCPFHFVDCRLMLAEEVSGSGGTNHSRNRPAHREGLGLPGRSLP